MNNSVFDKFYFRKATDRRESLNFRKFFLISSSLSTFSSNPRRDILQRRRIFALGRIFLLFTVFSFRRSSNPRPSASSSCDRTRRCAPRRLGAIDPRQANWRTAANHASAEAQPLCEPIGPARRHDLRLVTAHSIDRATGRQPADSAFRWGGQGETRKISSRSAWRRTSAIRAPSEARSKTSRSSRPGW